MERAGGDADAGLTGCRESRRRRKAEAGWVGGWGVLLSDEEAAGLVGWSHGSED